MNLFVRWSKKEYGLAPRVITLLLAGALFIFLIPYTLISLAPRLDFTLQLPTLSFGVVNFVLGIIMIVVGLFYGLWSNLAEIMRAGGTPVPVIPTQTLLVSGPFHHCRNPMTFGTITLYLGIGVLVGSISSILVVCIFAALLLTYLKTVEEKELALRFGNAYLEYKAKTPFIIPRPWRKP